MAREDDSIPALGLAVEATGGRTVELTRDGGSCRSPGARRGGSITPRRMEKKKDPNTKVTRGSSACSGSTGHVEAKLDASHHATWTLC